MAGRVNGTVGRAPGRRSPAYAWRPVIGEPSEAGSGWLTGASMPTSPEPRLPDRSASAARTHRSLVMNGLTTAEAARLTSYLCGFAPPEGDWAIDQLTRLLFIRELARSGHFGRLDGARPGD